MRLEERLVSLRKEKGFTQLKVAEELDVSRQAVSKWESGAALPSAENLKFLSKLYEVPVDYLLSDSMERPSYAEAAEEKERRIPKNKRKICVIVAVCVFAVVVAMVLLYKTSGSQNLGNASFEAMESKTWDDTEDDAGFSLEWN